MIYADFSNLVLTQRTQKDAEYYENAEGTK